ncbi:MAG: hypothetical protein KF799_03500 [Bdellovibrionales bacterium]|nr:hypothetical protein [Bdellovibrionales bacterium]
MSLQRWSLLVSLTLLSSFAGAQVKTRTQLRPPQARTGLAAELAAKPWALTTGLINYHYDEPGVMKIGGTLVELAGIYRHHLQSSVRPSYLMADLRYATSSSNSYDGGIMHFDKDGDYTHTTPNSAKSKDAIVEFKGVYGSTLINTATHALDLYGGLGRWQLNNKVDGSTAYRREAVYLYLPVGVTSARKVGSTFVWTMGAELDIYLNGSTTSKMGDAVKGASDIVHNQPSGSGYSVRTGSEFQVAGISMTSSIYYQVWDIETSDVVGKFIEPKNRTTMLGLNLGARF